MHSMLSQYMVVAESLHHHIRCDGPAWQRGSGTSGTQAQGDADFDGQIDDLDLGVWESQYGEPPNLRGVNVGVMARWDSVTGNGYLLRDITESCG